MIIHLRDFSKTLSRIPETRSGCIVDTNILFGASYHIDRLNTWADRFFRLCQQSSVPVYANLNIRSEFLDLHRRVLIREGLVELKKEYSSIFPKDLGDDIDKLEKRVRLCINENRPIRFSERDIKEFRESLLSLVPQIALNGQNLWQILCRDYVKPQLMAIWDDTTTDLAINFTETRATDLDEHFDRAPSWEGATAIVGEYGLGATDGLIIDFFACSKFPVLVTSDEQVIHAAEQEMGASRVILVPAEDELF